MKVNEQSGVEQKQPLVSVIMPAYNAEEYISEAVQSVMAQTYTNWELLILDDCSTDGTADKARCFSDLDPRITLYSNPKNIGVALTRNKGMALAKGSWVALLDSDDIWHKDKLEKQLVAAENTGADIIYCSYSLMDKNGEHLSDFIVPERTSYDDMLRKNVIGCSTVFMRSPILIHHHFSTEHYHEDYVLWLELLKSGYIAAASTDVLVDYRIVDGSRSNDKLKSARNRWLIYREIEKLSLGKAVRVFAAYAFNGFIKHKRL
ncbi:glycosyltransferase family 2 protein [Waltera sp.]|uniref:glycosyltransferase family 2 protein n=1 Tax=Waltera sp. TaxID=2815806 RepID=UPI003AB99A91